MTKIYPNYPIAGPPVPSISACADGAGEVAVLTVWRKSLLFNCSGFTVFDARGNLVFRVDNYSSKSCSEILLMDADGKPLFMIRRKKLLITDRWHIYDGEASAAGRPRFSARKHASLLQSKSMAHVIPCNWDSGPMYGVEGSFSQKSFAIYDEQRRAVAEIRRKDPVAGIAFGEDVFSLVVQPGFDHGFAMALVILLEQMFRSRAASIKC
ncbi:Protein LURP-one-related 8 [Apostasia shenzhenica]|uniref:Protein LURP-one-related 8 n=1 Tax=Apostasia shenzhenica TaxID=1088818 RepID=A0A2I0AXP7_9ASPA|nr:Protein LURP-one-related 8 [Apostasia shenzhenica]